MFAVGAMADRQGSAVKFVTATPVAMDLSYQRNKSKLQMHNM